MPRLIDCGVDPLGEILKEVVGTGLVVDDDPGGAPFHNFRFGTLHGLYRTADGTVEILAVENERRGNGHFRKFLKHLHDTFSRIVFKEIMNEELALRLSERGYRVNGDDMEFIKETAHAR